jgi:hypothetical protein
MQVQTVRKIGEVAGVTTLEVHYRRARNELVASAFA